MRLKELSRLHLLLILTVFAGFMVLYWSTFYSLHLKWVQWDQVYSHGYIVLLMSGYFIYSEKERFLALPARQQPIFLFPFFGLSLLWLVARLTDIQIVQQALLPALLGSLIFALFGWRIGLKSLFPVLFLYLAIPLWDLLLSVPFRIAAVAVTNQILGWVSIPAFIRGFTIETAGGAFIVAGGCAGLGFFLTAVVIGASHAYLFVDGIFRKIALVLFFAFVGIVSNWARVVALVLIGHYTKLDHYLFTDSHLGFGWVIFLIFMAPLLFFLNRVDLQQAGRVRRSLGGDYSVTSGRISPMFLACSILVVALAPALNYYVQSRDGAQFTIEVPRQLESFDVESTEPRWKPDFVGADDEQHFLLTAGEDQRFVLHVVYYREEGQGKEVINTENHLSDPNWKFDQGTVFVEGKRLTEGFLVNELLVNQLAGKAAVRYWYLIGGRVALSPIHAKLLHLQALANGRKDAALIMLRSDCRLQCDKEVLDQATVAVFENVGNWFHLRP